MIPIEQFISAKTGNISDSEDLIFFSSDYAAVIDGATARNKKKYNGVSSGRAAAEITYKAIEGLSPAATLREALDFITAEFNKFYLENGIDIQNYGDVITASCIIYSRYQNQIWMVGDCQCMINSKVYYNKNGIDEHFAFVRSVINQSELLKGRTKEWVSENDPGAVFISTLLTEQFLFQNHTKSLPGEIGYSAFDGRYIDEKNVRVLEPDGETKEIILASDGYPLLKPTLLESETALKKALAKDPLCIYTNKMVKGLKNNNVSFDDRSYLRFKP